MTALDLHAARAIKLFTRINFDLGVFNLRDVDEVEGVLVWLAEPVGSVVDPRGLELVERRGETGHDEPAERGEQSPRGSVPYRDEDDPLCLIPLGLRDRWVFTIGDPDFFPSIPHGHLGNKNRPEPKLSPYMGRALANDGSEVKKHRLTRQEMILLWNNEDFRALCLKQIAWYSEAFPDYQFPVGRRYRLPRWGL